MLLQVGVFMHCKRVLLKVSKVIMWFSNLSLVIAVSAVTFWLLSRLHLQSLVVALAVIAVVGCCLALATAVTVASFALVVVVAFSFIAIADVISFPCGCCQYAKVAHHPLSWFARTTWTLTGQAHAINLIAINGNFLCTGQCKGRSPSFILLNKLKNASKVWEALILFVHELYWFCLKYASRHTLMHHSITYQAGELMIPKWCVMSSFNFMMEWLYWDCYCNLNPFDDKKS